LTHLKEHLKEPLEHHNQMINTKNNQLNRNNMFLLKKMRNMDEQIDWAFICA
jgi:hypothetical protein